MTDPGRLQGQLEPRSRGRRTHLCVCCGFPIAVYGRLAPCLHVYCLTCAADMAVCLICQAPITKLERIPAESASVFISPATLQGYRSEVDLIRSTRDLQQKLVLLAQGGGMLGALGAPTGSAGVGPPPGPAPGPPPGPAHAAAAAMRQQQEQQHVKQSVVGLRGPMDPGVPLYVQQQMAGHAQY